LHDSLQCNGVMFPLYIVIRDIVAITRSWEV